MANGFSTRRFPSRRRRTAAGLRSIDRQVEPPQAFYGHDVTLRRRAAAAAMGSARRLRFPTPLIPSL